MTENPEGNHEELYGKPRQMSGRFAKRITKNNKLHNYAIVNV